MEGPRTACTSLTRRHDFFYLSTLWRYGGFSDFATFRMLEIGKDSAAYLFRLNVQICSVEMFYMFRIVMCKDFAKMFGMKTL